MAALRDACQHGVNPGPGEGPSMSRTRTVLLALVAAFIVSLLGAPAASAATAVIDAIDEAQTTHNLSSSGANWPTPIDLDRAPNGTAIEQTFSAPGTYTFLCKFHGNMTGSVTVAAEPTGPLENVLVF